MYTYSGSFAKEESTTTHQKPKSTVCSPPHILNPPCHCPVVWLPVWLQAPLLKFGLLSFIKEEKTDTCMYIADLPRLPGQVKVPSAGYSNIAAIR